MIVIKGAADSLKKDKKDFLWRIKTDTEKPIVLNIEIRT